MNEKDMIECYIYEVTKRVPSDMRDEIGMEIRSLIEDMSEENEATVDSVLERLGDPVEFARRYNDHDRYIIGPENYDNYIWVNKLVLIGIGISAVVSAVVQSITRVENYTKFIAEFITEFIVTALSGACSAIGIVTIIFAIMEYYKVKVDVKPKNEWNVKDITKNIEAVKGWTTSSLSPIPDKKSVISRWESMFSVVIASVFAVLMIFQPQFFGVFHFEGGKLAGSTCIFNLDEWNSLLPLLIFTIVIGLIDEIIRLVVGCYNKTVMYSSIVCGVIQMTGLIILLKFRPIWNNSFADELKVLVGRKEYGTGDILHYWGTDLISNIVLTILGGFIVFEIITACYKTYRYGER